MCLQADGHTVAAAGNIADALDLIVKQVFDLVFLDIRLGIDNGLDFLPTLKAESPWAPVIVITAYASIDTAVEAMKRGATDYLPKPFEPPQVQLVTRKVAEHRQLERRIESLQAALVRNGRRGRSANEYTGNARGNRTGPSCRCK